MEKINTIAEKTYSFSLEIIRLFKEMEAKREYIISKQLLRSGTSIGANVEEGNAALTKKDFIAKMSIASKEARETHYWLRLIKESELIKINVDDFFPKIEELIKILTSIIKTSQNNLKKRNG